MAATVVACGLAASGGAAAADQTWTIQTATSAGDIAYAITKDFTDSIEVLTGGRLAVRLVPVGAIVQYSETLDAVAAGILDGHITATVYFSGKDPGFALLGDLIAAYEHPDQLLAFMRLGGGNALLRDLYARHGVHYIGCATTGKEAFVSKIPILAVEDFSGVKLRAPEGMAQDIFERIGAAPVNIPASEVYTALERGVVDAADWATFSMNQALGFHDIAGYPIYPGIHSMPILDFSVYPARWQALPDDIKAILDMAARELARDMTRPRTSTMCGRQRQRASPSLIGPRRNARNCAISQSRCGGNGRAAVRRRSRRIRHRSFSSALSACSRPSNRR